MKPALVYVLTFDGASICRTVAVAQATDELSSWNDKTKQSIVSSVEKVTTADSLAYVPPAKRIVTFDNDGTLWAERRCISSFSTRSAE